LYCLGTDVFSSYGTTDVNALNLYNTSLNSSITDVEGFWTSLYYAINVANTTLYWATQVTGDTMVNVRVGEAKTLRAFYYYLLAETFGGVPLQLTRSTSSSNSFTRASEQDVYTQIIQDLKDACAVLPATTADFGRATKGCAQHLLAKVYLTRAYKSYGGGTADFTLAGTYADSVISSGTYSLVSTWSNLFDPTISGFQKNAEVIFSVQYSTTTTTNGSGNTLQQYFLWDTQSLTPIGRSSLYTKPNYVCSPDPFFFTLFDKTKDARYLGTIWNALICQTASSPFAVGDTVVYYPDTAWTAAQIAAVKYYVINPDQYRNTFLTLTRSYPEFKKFRDPNVAFQDAGGTRDTYVFRLAETYLIGAEAYLGAGNSAKALQYYNIIRARGAKSGADASTGLTYASEMQATSVSLDDILDERARELAGEEFRWLELKRSGKLLSRALAHNDELKTFQTSVDTHFLLRPIPQEEIDLNTGATLTQNPGYN
jgi:hypothetical protein